MKNILRDTVSFCPECLSKVKACVVLKKDAVYLEKHCSTHGVFNTLISNHPDYYREIHRAYFYFMKESLIQKDFLIHATNRCNLDCPICLARSNERDMKDYPKSLLIDILKGRRGNKIGLMGSEPTMREDIVDLISIVKNSGNIPELHTNGIKIAELSYLKKLKDAGLKEVHFQFDGFDDQVYLKIRGRNLLDLKLKALDNLKELEFSVDLKATIVKNVNEKEMSKILQFGIENDFIKEVFFLGCRSLGRAQDSKDDLFYMPDELIDILEKQRPELINRNKIKRFLKFYYMLLRIFKSRKCFYNQHFILIRDKAGVKTINSILDFKAIEKRIENIIDNNSKINSFFNIFKITPYFMKSCFMKYFFDFHKLAVLLKKGLDLSLIPKNFLLLGFISACDRYSYDEGIALNCGKGAISLELGIEDVGALDNVLREKNIDENISASK